MTLDTTDQQWHIVCGSAEIHELQRAKHIQVSNKHDLFLAIKHPHSEFYQGGWGPELLHFVDLGPYRGEVGQIHCTYTRYQDIAQWFLATMLRL